MYYLMELLQSQQVLINLSLFLTILEKKNQRNDIKIFSRKCNGIAKDGKLSTRES